MLEEEVMTHSRITTQELDHFSSTLVVIQMLDRASMKQLLKQDRGSSSIIDLLDLN